ncbi:MAG: amino acid permease [archaeon]
MVKEVKLKKELGLFQVTATGVGIIVGAGIYVLIGAAAGLGGNAVWISFLIAALVAVFSGLSYAEMSSIFPKDEGEYAYVKKPINKFWAFMTAYMLVLGSIISTAAVGLGFAGYFSNLFGFNHLILIAILAIAFFSLVNFYGIKASITMNIIFTFFAVGGLLLIIFLGFGVLGDVNLLEMSPHGLGGVFEAAALIFFAFIGFEAIVKLAEETKHPRHVVPMALLLSIIITTVLYVLVAISAVSLIGWEVLSASSAPLADVASSVFGAKTFFVMSIIALFATGSTLLIILITNSRILYGLGHQIPQLKFLSKVHKTRRTPWVAVLFAMLLSFIFLVFGKIETIAEIANFGIFFAFFMVNVSLIFLRYKAPNIKRKFKSPLNIGKFPVLALLGAIVSLFMLFNLAFKVLLAGFGFFFLGMVIYWVTKKFH